MLPLKSMTKLEDLTVFPGPDSERHSISVNTGALLIAQSMVISWV
jgi:hypothetical protein